MKKLRYRLFSIGQGWVRGDHHTTSAKSPRLWGTILLTITIFSLSLPAYAQYSGGTGDPNNPYQIATAEDLMLLGETPEDYDKHFILTADIDLDPNLSGRKVFDRAVIAPDTDPTLNEYGDQLYDGIAFTGTFDGDGHTISHLTITGNSYLALFGQLDFPAEVNGLGLVDVNIIGSGWYIGGVAGENLSWSYQSGGSVTNCYSNGAVSGNTCVGGLVGRNECYVTCCHSSGVVSGDNWNVGGLVGSNNYYGIITASYSTATVSGSSCVGGLAGDNSGCVDITNSYSTGVVTGDAYVGALVGYNGGNNRCYSSIGNCYSVATVMGAGECVGGLVGSNWDYGQKVTACFWDPQNSSQANAEMQMAQTFLDVGWDFVGETENGTDDIWKIAEGMGYPRLWWEKYSGGTGDPNDPYQIATAEDLILLGETPEDYDKHFILMADIDLDPNLPGRKVFDRAIIAPNWETPFSGVFDGNGYTISHLAIVGESYLGLFGLLEYGAEVRNLGVVDVNITGTGSYLGGLGGANGEWEGTRSGVVSNCYTTGVFSGTARNVGGVVGLNLGTVTGCYSAAAVIGDWHVGGLIGWNPGTVIRCQSGGTISGEFILGGLVGANGGNVTQCRSTASVSGADVWVESVGGLVGVSSGTIAQCYSTAKISSGGGLVGSNGGFVTQCYSTGMVGSTGGGLVGSNEWANRGGMLYLGHIADSLWDIQTSGQTTSAGGVGKTTADMQTAKTFLDAGWDFVGETVNGTEDIWKITEGMGYPRLWWEKYSGGTGEPNDPYQIATAEDLILLGETPEDYDKHFLLCADIDLDPNLPGGRVFDRAVIAPELNDTNYDSWGHPVFSGMPYNGVFDGGGHTLSHLTIEGGGYLGLFGRLESGAEVKNLGIVDVNVTGSGDFVGGLVGSLCYASEIWPNSSSCKVTQCYSTGEVRGNDYVGGLMGLNLNLQGDVTQCCSAAAVTGSNYVGGLLGDNGGRVIHCYSAGLVTGLGDYVGGLVGRGYWAAVYGGFIVSFRGGNTIDCFWDIQTSDTLDGVGGIDADLRGVIGKTTAEMQTASTFLDAGWDFVGETANGTEDIWWILEGQDYPRLWWEAK